MCLGIPGEVDRGPRRVTACAFAQVRFGGITREVCLECQPDAGVGDFVLVHVGFAIARIDREEAARAWDGARADRQPRGGRAVRSSARPPFAGARHEVPRRVSRSRRRRRRWCGASREAVTRPWVLMEVCGGQTHSIVRYGLDRLLPPIDRAGARPGLSGVRDLARDDRSRARHRRRSPTSSSRSFGDMLRVPGSRGDLLRLRSRGADVRVVYSPLDALALARDNPHKRVVFFAIGFETTAPANAMAALQAQEAERRPTSRSWSRTCWCRRRSRRSCRRRATACRASSAPATSAPSWAFASTRRWPSAIASRSSSPASSRSISCEGILMAVQQLEAGRADVENQYARTVARDGNRAARELIDEVFEVADRKWRGVGAIPKSGYRLRCGVPRLRRRAHLRRRRHRHARARALHQRRSSCAASRSRATAPRSARTARRRRRSARRWSRPRAPAPPTSSTGAAPRERSHERRDPPQGARERRHAAARSSRRTRRASRPAPRRWPSASARAGACSPWATAAPPCDAQHLAVEFSIRSSRSGARCRRSACRATRRCSPPSATTPTSRASSSISSSSLARPATSPSASRPRARRPT